MLETVLHAHLAAHGAVQTDDRGVTLPRHFGDPEAEYRALTGGAALLDLGYRTLVRATGPDRVDFLQGMLTNDLARLAPGGGCGALLLTIQGRVTADVRVAALSDAHLLDVDVRARDAFIDALQKLIIADDVELEPPAEPVALIAVDGPEAIGVVGLDGLAPWAHRETTVGGVAVRAMRASEVRGPGVVLHVPAGGATTVWDALVAAGARPCGMDAIEGRRDRGGCAAHRARHGRQDPRARGAGGGRAQHHEGLLPRAGGGGTWHRARPRESPARTAGARRAATGVRGLAGARRQGGGTSHQRGARLRRRRARRARLRASRALGSGDRRSRCVAGTASPWRASPHGPSRDGHRGSAGLAQAGALEPLAASLLPHRHGDSARQAVPLRLLRCRRCCATSPGPASSRAATTR